jgi:hypothetical protein
MRDDVSTLLERIERHAPPGDAAVTAGRPAPLQAAHEGEGAHR